MISAVVLGAALVNADRSSGTWTGAVEARGNYYWERSTRVFAPSLNVTLDAPNGVRVTGSYLLDMITSASVAAGLVSDVRFTERRHDGSLGLGYEFDLGDPKLLTTLSGRYSHEPDYDSYSGNFGAQLSLNDRSTVIGLNFNYMHDEVGRILRGASRAMGGRDLSNRGKVGTLNHYFLGLSWTQLVTPVLYFELGYDLTYQNGFQANTYRTVAVSGVPFAENHPRERLRNALYGKLAYYFRPTRTAIHALYRTYIDSWDIVALTPEVRIFQEVTDLATLRFRYRYYTQTNAYFQNDPSEYHLGDTYVTADPKMTRFHSHLVGGQVMLKMDFLQDTALAFAADSSIDFSFDYIWNTNRFGDGVIAQAGLRVPF